MSFKNVGRYVFNIFKVFPYVPILHTQDVLYNVKILRLSWMNDLAYWLPFSIVEGGH
jgi:hypothetical protein